MSDLICIDTNILIRFLRADHPTLSSRAKEIFNQGQLGKAKIYLDEIVVAEAVWLLSSFYKLKRQAIASQLQKLIVIDWLINPRKKLILAALSTFASTKLDYVDCWLFWLTKSLKGKLKTFDDKLRKLKQRPVSS